MVGAVVCPHPPLLLRELGGAEDPVADLRQACDSALATALALGPDAVLVVGGHESSGSWDPSLSPPVHRYAGPVGTGAAAGGSRPDVVLPTSLGVGARLLEDAGWTGPTWLRSVAWNAGPTETARAVEPTGAAREVLLVLADGGARRGEKAPGYLDPRAHAYDDTVSAAVRAADAAVLEDADPGLADDLMVLGRAALAALGSRARAEGGHLRSRVLYEDDPFGVLYRVAVWERTR